MFDVEAKIPTDGTADKLPLMWQSLLEERFHLKIHRAPRDLPAYELVIGKGFKLKESVYTRESALRAGMPPPGLIGSLPRDGGLHIQGTAVPLSPGFTTLLQNQVQGYPVVDKTGLTGKYDIDIQFSPTNVSSQAEFALPSLTTVLEQDLGLRLVKKTVIFDVIVIDNVDQTPTEN